MAPCARAGDEGTPVFAGWGGTAAGDGRTAKEARINRDREYLRLGAFTSKSACIFGDEGGATVVNEKAPRCPLNLLAN